MRSGSGWSPYKLTKGGGLGLLDGEMAGPRIGPRLFREITSPTQGGVYSQFRLSGLTVDDVTGAVVGNCTVNLFDTVTNVLVQTLTSDANGVYAFTLGTGTQTCYLVAYKATAPDMYGTTVNSLVGS